MIKCTHCHRPERELRPPVVQFSHAAGAPVCLWCHLAAQRKIRRRDGSYAYAGGPSA